MISPCRGRGVPQRHADRFENDRVVFVDPRRNFFEQHIAELAGDLVCRPRTIGDHRRVGLPRRFAAEHFLFPGHDHARICNRRARQLPARNRYDQGAGPNPFGLDDWRTSAGCNANDRRMLDRRARIIYRFDIDAKLGSDPRIVGSGGALRSD